jgi:ubiquitin-protein ligase
MNLNPVTTKPTRNMDTLSRMPIALRRRLLQDIAEVQEEPYPNVFLHIHDEDLTQACLVLTQPDPEPLHLRIQFLDDYPLQAPHITIQSVVVHPNVFGDYICASMLNTNEGWTPAYTLRGILIQLISFFCSDTLEQDTGGMMNLNEYRSRAEAGGWCQCYLCRGHGNSSPNRVQCSSCGFDAQAGHQTAGHTSAQNGVSGSGTAIGELGSSPRQRSKLFEMPDEIILRLMTFADTVDIISFAEAVPTIKHMLHGYDIIRIRELQCFCLKKSYLITKLGIGVSVTGGNRPIFRSEFDLLSKKRTILSTFASLSKVLSSTDGFLCPCRMGIEVKSDSRHLPRSYNCTRWHR